MPVWRVLQAACLLGWVGLALLQMYEDPLEVNYPDYYNEIGEEEPEVAPTTPLPPPCAAPEFSKWDKLFTMLENSQMKENMLLQYSDDLMKVELRSLRGDVLQFVAKYGGSCAAAVESATRRAGAQTEQRLQQVLDQLRESSGCLKEERDHLRGALEGVLRDQAARLDRLERGCLSGGAAPGHQDTTGPAKGFQTRQATQGDTMQGDTRQGDTSMRDISAQQEKLWEKIERLREMPSCVLPAGCEMALVFPMRSQTTRAEVTPERPLQTRAITVCLWARPTQLLRKVVLFSYGTTSNPLEVQLLLIGRNALFTVGGEAHLVEAREAVGEGTWSHLCGTWSSEEGLATLWVHGQRAASSPGVAEGHQLPHGGEIILGQEYSTDGLAKRFGFQNTFDVNTAFTGRMTGVNVWDRVLGEDEISQQAQLKGRGCLTRGNLVGWGVSQIAVKGGVELIY